MSKLTPPPVAVAITVSDSCSAGEREDVSGLVLLDALKTWGAVIHSYECIPDDRPTIAGRMRHFADSGDVDLIVTTGGTGFAPRQGFEEMSWLFAANLQDHAAAAVANLQGEANFLEQAVFVDQVSAESVLALQQTAKQAWKQAFHQVMQEAQDRFDGDALLPEPQRDHRARFGVYFYSEREE